MAIPTPVNGQITDAVTQVSVANMGAAPALASSLLRQVWAHGVADAERNGAPRA